MLKFFVTPEFRSDLLGHLEAAKASKATKMVVRVNMHMDPTVFKVVDFKSEYKLAPWP